MSEDTFSIDGKVYKIKSLTKDSKKLYDRLRQINERLRELHDLKAVLNRAKNGYIADLQTEIVQSKSGLDMSKLFFDD